MIDRDTNAFEFEPSSEQKERLDVLIQLVIALRSKKAKFAVVGGYGLDALYGSLTRKHNDYDFLVFDESQSDFTECLLASGFTYDHRENSGVIVFVHQETGTKLDYSSTRTAQSIIDNLEDIEVDFEHPDSIVLGTLSHTLIPTLNLSLHKQGILIQQLRHNSVSPNVKHDGRLLETLENKNRL